MEFGHRTRLGKGTSPKYKPKKNGKAWVEGKKYLNTVVPKVDKVAPKILMKKMDGNTEMMTSIKNAVTKAVYDCFGNAVLYRIHRTRFFSEPCFIVEMFPLNVQATNTFLDDETQTVRIRYVPKDISQDEFIYVAEKLRGLFLYNPLVLSDGMRIRSFSIDFSLKTTRL